MTLKISRAQRTLLAQLTLYPLNAGKLWGHSSPKWHSEEAEFTPWCNKSSTVSKLWVDWDLIKSLGKVQLCQKFGLAHLANKFVHSLYTFPGSSL